MLIAKRYGLVVVLLIALLFIGACKENRINDPEMKVYVETLIKERKDTQANFTSSLDENRITSIAFFKGEGRKRSIRKINLTEIQGKFLFFLPFPTAEPLKIGEILNKAGLDETSLPEILDIIKYLETFKIIEIKN